MKEKPIFEEFFIRLISQPNIGGKLLIGGLLSFIPIVNFLAFGYLYRVALQLRQRGELDLPEWNDWAGLFSDGLKFAAVWALYCLLPMLCALGISSVFAQFGVAVLPNLLLSVVFVVSSFLFCAALYRLQMRADFKDVLDLVLIIRMNTLDLLGLILPALVFLGIFALGWPLYGFTFFAGFLLLVTYTGIRYRMLEQR